MNNNNALDTMHDQVANLMFLIQDGHIPEAIRLLRQTPELGVYEDSDELDWDCVYTYATKTIPNDTELMALLDTFRFRIDLYFLRTSPMAAARSAGRTEIMEHLTRIGLDAPSVRDFED